MGALPCKMRIQANEDVYAATKQRMAVAEEQHKKNCTRVIKASGPDIGRKVKVKKGMGALPKRETSPPPYRAIGPPPGAAAVGGGGAGKPRSSSANSFSRHESSNIGSNGNHMDAGNPHMENRISNGPSIPGLGRMMGGANKRSSGGNQDISKRPIKERLIHLLALRAFKKPELYDRIRREGFRGEKNALVSALQQVAYMNGNTYHLIRSLWNDVQEDWPFYSEQDRQVLKRRKPQNLTPPGSDGSSGSGHSPTSTHPGSPPPAISPAAPSPANGRLPPLEGAPGAKRPGYYDGADGIITKRQRISHYKRTTGSEWPSSNSVTASNNSGGASSNNNFNNSIMNNCNNVSGSTLQQQPQRNRLDPANRRPPPLEARSAGGSPGHHPPSSRHQRHSSPAHGCRAATTARPPREEVSGESVTVVQGASGLSHSPEGSAAAVCRSGGRGGGGGVGGVDGVGDEGRGSVEVSESVRDKTTSNNHGWSSNKSVARCAPSSPEGPRFQGYSKVQERVSAAAPSGRGGGHGRVIVSAEVREAEVESDRASSEYPDYLTEYTTIMTLEQRNKYKADFNADYSEYRELHTVVARVSSKFAVLEERLRQQEEGSEEWNNIKDQIVREYQENQRDQQYPEAKKKFQYLHEKLSHIKRMVLEYDSSNVGHVASVQPQKH
ncbi:RNA polymerase II elongation factor Ell isoform X2 [Ischnura elegans]|nr:RNA polymerase II elongation factor Ell isoform X2 [Ischnura elegans]